MPNTWMRGIEMAQRTCSVDGCEKLVQSRGFCPAHYQRWRRNGDPVISGKRVIPAADRFMAKVRRDPNGCWTWTATIQSAGYGTFSLNGRMLQAHRWSYEHFVGPIPEGLVIDHLCRNRACVNPAHLEPVTFLENVRRGEQGKWNATKTHCAQGHPFDEANTHVRPNGKRKCRACGAEQHRRRRAARKEGTDG